MTAVAITGGIGSGKSATARILSDGGFCLVDTDDLAREVVAPGGECLGRIIRAFGEGILGADRHLDRAAMAARVFSDPGARERLEAIVHPAIHARWTGLLEEWRSQRLTVAFVVIPLLFEKGYQARFDRVISVHCTAGSQWRRLSERGWSDSAIEGRLRAQWDPSRKAELADHVIWTEGSLGSHAAQWRRLLAWHGWISGCRA